MSGSPTPRPALKKAADAHIHPAAPGLRPVTLRHAGEPAAAPAEPSAPAPEPEPGRAGKGGRERGARPLTALSRPLGGSTSDSLRPPGRRSGGRPAKAGGKKVELSVKVPKTLRKEFLAAVKADRRNADDVVAALLRGWLDG